MTANEAWDTIISSLLGKPNGLPTVPKVKREPVWFTASTDGETLFIDEAKINKPSSKLSMRRQLEHGTFGNIYLLYLRRENGEQVSAEASGKRHLKDNGLGCLEGQDDVITLNLEQRGQLEG